MRHQKERQIDHTAHSFLGELFKVRACKRCSQTSWIPMIWVSLEVLCIQQGLDHTPQLLHGGGRLLVDLGVLERYT